MVDVDVSKIREQLETRLKSLNQRIEDIEGDLRTAPSADFEEQATETEGDQVLEGVEDSARIEAQQIHAALQRIESGTYGECATCGEPISEQRLKALPYAMQCISCARG
ncbi:MAG: TraR/DksA family transcriptional regulator [Kiloniellales bacterium]|jgi:DnaK suppressor protein|nr:TraR/DksA family transcriptional regulator [Kiloniellales bacterium]